jgi:asparagine synthase (glutamine-hydrolysing)
MLLHELKKNIKSPFSFMEYFDYENRAVAATAFMTSIIAKKLRSSFVYERAIDNRKSLYRSLSGSLFDRQVKYEMLSYLPDLLIRQDKMSMAHSIENRVPFLDNEVVQNSFSIPEKYLLIRKSPEGYNSEKYLLKKIVASSFGDEYAFREKMGFGIPVREFLLNNKFSEYLTDKILPGIKRRGLFNYELVSRWIADLRILRYYELDALWVIISFEIWASVYLDGSYENRNS